MPANAPMLRLDESPALCSTSTLRHYHAYGVSICSELPLPLPEIREDQGPSLFELEIRASNEPLFGVIPEEVTLKHNPFSGLDFGHLPDGSTYARWDDIGEALISTNGRSIACHPFPQTNSEAFYVYLLAQALSFALVKGGFEPLHATAVALDDQAIAFLGDCGFGKSTLAAAFLQAGYRLLTDDLLLLQNTTRGILAYPGPARIKLFPEIAREFLGKASSGVLLNPETQKLIIPLDYNQVCTDPALLTTTYILARGDDVAGRDIRILPVSEREAFVMLLRSAFNYVISDPDRLRRQFEAAQALIGTIIVKRLSYPRSLEHLHLVREAILSDLCAAKSESNACKS